MNNKKLNYFKVVQSHNHIWAVVQGIKEKGRDCWRDCWRDCSPTITSAACCRPAAGPRAALGAGAATPCQRRRADGRHLQRLSGTRWRLPITIRTWEVFGVTSLLLGGLRSELLHGDFGCELLHGDFGCELLHGDFGWTSQSQTPWNGHPYLTPTPLQN